MMYYIHCLIIIMIATAIIMHLLYRIPTPLHPMYTIMCTTLHSHSYKQLPSLKRQTKESYSTELDCLSVIGPFVQCVM